MAPAGIEYVIHSQAGASLAVDLSAGAGRSFEARFYDPRTGGLTEATRVRGGDAQQPFAKPDARDWVLWIRREAAHRS